MCSERSVVAPAGNLQSLPRCKLTSAEHKPNTLTTHLAAIANAFPVNAKLEARMLLCRINSFTIVSSALQIERLNGSLSSLQKTKRSQNDDKS